MADDAGRKLFEDIARKAAHLDENDSDFVETAEETRAKLRALSIRLTPCFDEARKRGDTRRARAIDEVITRIDALRMSIGQALIRHLDNSPDVAAACKRIGAINGELDKAAEKVAETADDLGKVTNVLTELTKLVGWVKDVSSDG